MASEDRASAAPAGVLPDALARTPAESQGFLVRRLTQESARDLAAQAFDTALGIVCAENTVTADEIGADPKVVFSMRRGVKTLGVYRLLQVNARSFEETVRQLRAARERVYGEQPVGDAHDALSSAVEWCGSLTQKAAPVLRRLAKNGRPKVADVKILEGEMEALENAMRKLRVAFDTAKREAVK